MKAAFRKTAYFPSRTDTIIEEDWDLLKLYMCREWDVEELFDAHLVWDSLRDGCTVLIDGYLYCVYNDEEIYEPGLQFGLFTGDLVMLDSDEEPQR